MPTGCFHWEKFLQFLSAHAPRFESACTLVIDMNSNLKAIAGMYKLVLTFPFQGKGYVAALEERLVVADLFPATFNPFSFAQLGLLADQGKLIDAYLAKVTEQMKHFQLSLGWCGQSMLPREVTKREELSSLACPLQLKALLQVYQGKGCHYGAKAYESVTTQAFYIRYFLSETVLDQAWSDCWRGGGGARREFL